MILPIFESMFVVVWRQIQCKSYQTDIVKLTRNVYFQPASMSYSMNRQLLSPNPHSKPNIFYIQNTLNVKNLFLKTVGPYSIHIKSFIFVDVYFYFTNLVPLTCNVSIFNQLGHLHILLHQHSNKRQPGYLMNRVNDNVTSLSPNINL